MGDFGKKLKGLFVESDGSEEKKKQEETLPVTASNVALEKVAPVNVIVPIISDIPKKENQFYVKLTAELLKRKGNLEVFYTTLASFDGIITDERQKHLAALKVLENQGINVQGLVAEFDIKNQVFEAEADKIRQSFAEFENGLAEKAKGFTRIDNEIARLDAEKQRLEEEKKALSKEIEDSRTAMQGNKNLAESAISIVAQEIAAQKHSLSIHLQN